MSVLLRGAAGAVSSTSVVGGSVRRVRRRDGLLLVRALCVPARHRVSALLVVHVEIVRVALVVVLHGTGRVGVAVSPAPVLAQSLLLDGVVQVQLSHPDGPPPLGGIVAHVLQEEVVDLRGQYADEARMHTYMPRDVPAECEDNVDKQVLAHTKAQQDGNRGQQDTENKDRTLEEVEAMGFPACERGTRGVRTYSSRRLPV